MYELINNVPIQIKEYRRQRVVTFKDIDRVHNRPEGTAKKRFNDNRKRFIEGEDYFKICADEIRTDKIMDISPKTHGDIILLTKNGYLMLVKSFTDDLAWDVQRQLVNTYFGVKELTTLTTKQLADIKKTVDSALTEKTEEIINKTVIKTVQTLIPCFDMLNRNNDKKTANIIKKAVSETTKSLVAYFDFLIKLLK